MIIDHHNALYVTAVTEAIEAGRRDLFQLTDVCPECGQLQAFLENDGHLVVTESPITSDAYMTDGHVFVVIACEGYWVVDPATVGISSPNWQPIAAMHADDAADGYRRGDHNEGGWPAN